MRGGIRDDFQGCLGPSWAALDGRNSGTDPGFLEGAGDNRRIMTPITDVSLFLGAHIPSGGGTEVARKVYLEFKSEIWVGN